MISLVCWESEKLEPVGGIWSMSCSLLFRITITSCFLPAGCIQQFFGCTLTPLPALTPVAIPSRADWVPPPVLGCGGSHPAARRRSLCLPALMWWASPSSHLAPASQTSCTFLLPVLGLEVVTASISQQQISISGFYTMRVILQYSVFATTFNIFVAQ